MGDCFACLRKITTKEQVIIAYLILVQAMIILRDVLSNEYYSIFWFCDFAPILLISAFLMRDRQFVKGIINLGLIVQLLFIIDFLTFVFSGIQIPHITNTFNHPAAYSVAALIMHMTIPIIFVLGYREKPDRRSLFYSIGMIMFLFAITLLFTPPSMNANAVFSTDFLVGFTLPYYPVFYPIAAFFIIVVPTYYLQRKAYGLSRKKR